MAGDTPHATTRVLRSHSCPGYHTPRVALSFAHSDDSFEKAYFARTHLPFPPVALRLALLGGQMQIYHQRFSFSHGELAFYYKLFLSREGDFDAEYVVKVKKEFAAGVREAEERVAEGRSPAAAAGAATATTGGDEDDDDVMDEALEAMLEAAAAGAEFDDDFDDYAEAMSDGCDEDGEEAESA